VVTFIFLFRLCFICWFIRVWLNSYILDCLAYDSWLPFLEKSVFRGLPFLEKTFSWKAVAVFVCIQVIIVSWQWAWARYISIWLCALGIFANSRLCIFWRGIISLLKGKFKLTEWGYCRWVYCQSCRSYGYGYCLSYRYGYCRSYG
jgi:hypothetical protein